MSLVFGLSACWAVLAGVALQLQQAQLSSVGGYVGLGLLACVGLLVSGVCLRRTGVQAALRRRAASGLCCLCLAALAFAQTGWRACDRLAAQLPAPLEGQHLIAEGEVMGLPQVGKDGLRFRFRIDQLTDANGTSVLPPAQAILVWLGWYQALPMDLRAGERWRLPVKLKAPHGHVNPHGFDFELWLWEQHIAATGYVRVQGMQVQRLAFAARWSLDAWRHKVRDAIERAVDDQALAGVLAALLVGDQASIDRADWDVFRATGVAHLMAISGLHITGMAWLVGVWVGAVWRRSRWLGTSRAPALWLATPYVARWAGMVAAVVYALFSGWGIPAQRTVWMLCLVHGLALHGRRWPWLLSWSVVAAWVVMLDPWAMLQAGFALSFVAVGLLFVSGGVGQQPQVTQTVWQRARASSAALLREQVLMTVCLAPLSLLVFQQISLIGLLANLMAVPWVTLVVTPLCMLGLVWSGFWVAAAWCLQAGMPLLQTLSHWPWAQWSVAAAPAWVGVFALLGGVSLAMPWPWWWRVGGLCWCLPLLSWHTARPVQGTFELWAADMGQGHAVLLRTQHHALLYDTGPRYSSEADAGQRVIVPLLRAIGERLDRVLLSHQDADHSGGLRAVLAMQPQADVWTSVSPDSPVLTAALSGLSRVSQPMPCLKGQRWQWDGVQFEMLHPHSAPLTQPHPSRLKPNALSCVLRVQDAQGISALLVGDIEAEQERALVDAGDVLAANWLLVPHHGSSTSSTSAFLQAVQPQWAVVQAGYRNRYGHPRPEVMARYAQAGISVVQTATCGAALWRSNTPQTMQCERVLHPHYWHRGHPPMP